MCKSVTRYQDNEMARPTATNHRCVRGGTARGVMSCGPLYAVRPRVIFAEKAPELANTSRTRSPS